MKKNKKLKALKKTTSLTALSALLLATLCQPTCFATSVEEINNEFERQVAEAKSKTSNNSFTNSYSTPTDSGPLTADEEVRYYSLIGIDGFNYIGLWKKFAYAKFDAPKTKTNFQDIELFNLPDIQDGKMWLAGVQLDGSNEEEIKPVELVKSETGDYKIENFNMKNKHGINRLNLYRGYSKDSKTLFAFLRFPYYGEYTPASQKTITINDVRDTHENTILKPNGSAAKVTINRYQNNILSFDISDVLNYSTDFNEPFVAAIFEEGTGDPDLITAAYSSRLANDTKNPKGYLNFQIPADITKNSTKTYEVHIYESRFETPEFLAKFSFKPAELLR